MSQVFDEIDDTVRQFMERQHLFFVGTAPRAGRINISPKGLDGFRVLGPKRVAYLDLTGSGVETIAHLRDDNRIVLMFCAFEGPANIVRLHGTAAAHERGTPAFKTLKEHFALTTPGERAIIDVAVERVSTSCGYGIPLYDYRGQRDQLTRFYDHNGEEGMRDYRATKNAVSIDGLKGFEGV